jgi:hypothetical protein
MGTDVALHAS